MGAYARAPDHCWAKVRFDFRQAFDLEGVLESIQELRGIDRDTALLRLAKHREYMERMNYAPDAGVWMKFNMFQLGKYIFMVGADKNAVPGVQLLEFVANEEDIPEGEYIMPVGLKASFTPSGLRGVVPWFRGPLGIADRIYAAGGDPDEIDLEDINQVVGEMKRIGCRLSDLLGV